MTARRGDMIAHMSLEDLSPGKYVLRVRGERGAFGAIGAP
jgi:hypothetical protein